MNTFNIKLKIALTISLIKFFILVVMLLCLFFVFLLLAEPGFFLCFWALRLGATNGVRLAGFLTISDSGLCSFN
jgi:hypothetical protein